MLDLGMLYFNHERRLTTTNVVDPFIVTENSPGLSHRLVDAAGTNFNHMFNLLEIEARDFAGLQGHNDDLSCFPPPLRLNAAPLGSHNPGAM
jgi:hypothetical protein